MEIGCWGPVVQCNIVERGAINHMGGCMVAGGACIGCTMPGFPDKYSPVLQGAARLRDLGRGVAGDRRRHPPAAAHVDAQRQPRADLGSRQRPHAPAGAPPTATPNPIEVANAKFYKKLQYRGTVNHATRNKKQPQPKSMEILRQMGVDMDASTDVLQEHVITREEL